MPEGDTIHRAANRIRAALGGRVPELIATPHPRFARDRWPERLDGRRVDAVDAHGKHLYVRFEGDLVIHSHLRMTGAWGVHRTGERWRRSPRRAWLVMQTPEHAVVQFDGPVLELLTESRTRFDQRLTALGPDVLGESFDERRFMRRLREDDPRRPIGDTLLDQRIVAGLGTVWRSEACWLAQIDPRRPAGEVRDEEALAAVLGIRPRMQAAVADPRGDRGKNVYNRAGRACPRCGTRIRGGTLGDDNRPSYWCPGCQT